MSQQAAIQMNLFTGHLPCSGKHGLKQLDWRCQAILPKEAAEKAVCLI